MHPELSHLALQRFLAPAPLERHTQLAMPAAECTQAGTHDFLVLMQLPELGPDDSTSADELREAV